ncbi:hypothetical protein ONZ45_g11590 [Pleurotus djamor]|nr:hypothetical protein ONZ45_g11590 [Pleurotus djamor]
MIAPAAGRLAEEFGITSTVVTALTTSIFVLAYAVGPLLLGPLSEIFGRSRVLQLANLFYLAYAPILLEQKAERIRKAMIDNVNDDEKDATKYPKYREVRTVYDSDDRNWKHIMKKSLIRPFMLFFAEPIVQLLGLYMAFIYGVFYLFLTTMPSIFEGAYGQAPGIAGLHYIAIGVGLTGASQFNARAMDWMYGYLIRREQKRNGGGDVEGGAAKGLGKGKPEYRLPSMVPGTILLPIGLFIAGWSAQYKVFWIVPDIGIALIGAGIILNFQSIQTYVIDTFTLHAASALAAVSFLRSIAGFGFPLFAPAMYRSLGFGKGDTVLAVVSIAIGCPAPWLFWKYGERIRHASRYAQKQAKPVHAPPSSSPEATQATVTDTISAHSSPLPSSSPTAQTPSSDTTTKS